MALWFPPVVTLTLQILNTELSWITVKSFLANNMLASACKCEVPPAVFETECVKKWFSQL